jgi:hypothetical protein
VGVLTFILPAAWAAERTTGGKLLHPKFTVVAKGADHVYTSGSYVLFAVHGNGRHVLLADHRNKQVVLRRADGCVVRGFAVPWILFGACPGSATVRWDRLYNVSTRRWTSLKCDVCGDGEAWGYRNAPIRQSLSACGLCPNPVG